MTGWDFLVDKLCKNIIKTFPSRYRLIPRADNPDIGMLSQFVIWKGPSGRRLFLHHFHCPEIKTHAHNHRWSYMRSFVLSGFYVEERYRLGSDAYSKCLRDRFRTHSMNKETIHRVYHWSERCWTLFYCGKDEREWGYFNLNDMNYTPWQGFVKKIIPKI